MRGGRATLGDLDGARLSVTPWVTGRAGLARGLAPAQWRAFGQLLGAVHAAGPPPGLRAALPAETYRLAAAPEVLGIAARLRPPDADVLSAALRAVWRPALPLVEEVVDRAAALGARLAARRAPEVICHNDPHLGNVVVDDEDGVWLLDWDDCLLAPRERDLVLVHDWAFPDCVPGQGAIGARELGWFREGYGDEPVDAELLAWFTAVRAVEELTWATRALDRDEDAAARAFALEIVRWQLSPSGVLATALRRMAAVAA